MEHQIHQLLETSPATLEGRNKKVMSYTSNSDSFDFYTDQFLEEDNFEIGAAIKKENLEEAPAAMIDVISFLKQHVSKDSVVLEIGGSRNQRRSGFPYEVFENYIPLDISISSMVAYSELYDRMSIACDAHKLPFKDEVIDVVYTHTFLEHPMKPEEVVEEIDRVVKPGGMIIHTDAWHCRWWQKYGIFRVKKWGDLNLKEKLIYMGAYISELKLIRFPLIVSRRFFKEFFLSNKQASPLNYKKLEPNYELKIYKDEDAAASIDPIDLFRFYQARGYELAQPKSFLQRLFFKDKILYLVKRG